MPVLSGSAVNGDRAAGTLATTQLTLVTTWQLLLGKVLASWISSLSFIVVAAPFLLIGAAISSTPVLSVPAAIGVLELGVRRVQRARRRVVGDRALACTYLTLSLQNEGTLPTWVLGVVLHIITIALMLWWAWARTGTPARRLGGKPRGLMAHRPPAPPRVGWAIGGRRCILRRPRGRCAPVVRGGDRLRWLLTASNWLYRIVPIRIATPTGATTRTGG